MLSHFSMSHQVTLASDSELSDVHLLFNTTPGMIAFSLSWSGPCSYTIGMGGETTANLRFRLSGLQVATHVSLNLMSWNIAYLTFALLYLHTF